jgi:thiamine-phosphate pyrophosphorylase
MTNLIVISREFDVENEVEIVKALFGEGMQLLHLKKPLWNEDTHRHFFDQIPVSFHERISLHQHPGLGIEYGSKYYHVKEKERKMDLALETGFIKSTSFHSYKDLAAQQEKWNYCFLSPVFDSISKKNYSAVYSDLVIESGLKTKVFALGGVKAENVAGVFERGFYGAAISGTIWLDPGNAIRTFKQIKNSCGRNVHTY